MSALGTTASRAARAAARLPRAAKRRLVGRWHRRALKLELATLERRPLVSVVMPVYEPRADFLAAALRSVRRQGYPEWELVAVDDGSRSRAAARVLRRFARRDSRIRFERSPSNEGISGATNRALAMARGELVALIDQDDLLGPGALLETVRWLLKHPADDAVYTDQATIGRFGRVQHLFHKPDFSYVYALGAMYVGHLLTVRRSVIERLGGFDPAYDGIQDYEFLLRLVEAGSGIGHVPAIHYFWRAIPGSVAADPGAKPGLDELQARAVQEHLDRIGCAVEARPRGGHRVRLARRGPAGRSFSIVIPSRDEGELIERCLDSIHEHPAGADFEVVVVDGGTVDDRALRAYECHRVRLVDGSEGEFNYSRANNLGVEAATGDLLLLLNNDTEVLGSDWLGDLESHMRLPGVGAVGPMLVYPDGSVQHAGVALGMRGTADHLMRGFDPDSDGLGGSLSCAREVSAVTAAAICLPRSLYRELGGMNTDYMVQYQDVDLCMRIRDRGLSVIYSPRPRFVHHESRSRGRAYDQTDRALLLDSWWDEIHAGDRFYNPALSLERGDYSPRP